MHTRMAAFAGLMLVWASASSAQSWREAYDRGDYPAAAPLLQAIVFEHPHGESRYPDVQAIQTLAKLYAEGRGVPRDPLTACSLSNFGSGAAVYTHGERDPRTVAVQQQVEAYCVPLTPGERREAMTPGGCLPQGPEPRVLFISATRKVELGRSQLRVVDRGHTREYSLGSLVRCPQQVPLVRYLRVAAPKGSRLSAREFVEVYSWYSTSTNGRKMHSLEWSAIELTPQSAVVRARTLLDLRAGSAWPAQPVPPHFSRGVTLSMHSSGDVRWHMTGRPSLRGVIGRPGGLRAAAGTR